MRTGFSGKQEIYLEIAERYKQYIRLGALRAGEKLPSVRAAAVELGVNPNTVARAYSQLEADGFIKALPKKGVFVIWGEESELSCGEEKSAILALKERGFSKDLILRLVEEVYGKDD